MGWRIVVELGLVIGCLPWFLPGWLEMELLAEPAKEPREFRGKVVLISSILQHEGAALDQDAAPLWVGIVGDDGKLIPLVKDAGSRMFFKDERLRDRPVVLRGRLVGGEQFLQVLQAFTMIKGRRHEPFYWCDICKIKRFEPNACDCCGAPLEFREEPTDR